MKKMILSAAAMAVILAASSCGQQKNIPVRDGSKIGYSLSFFRNAAALQGADENVFVSPYSAGVALSMLADGAEGETRNELLAALHGVDFSGAALCQDTAIDVRSANAAWLKDGFEIKKSYRKRLADAYRADVENLDFSDPASVGIINGWCSDNTNGKIDEIIDNISPDMMMFLMNALYFKASWEKSFDERSTVDMSFHGSVRESRVPFMYSKDKFRYAEYQGCQMIELPYSGGKYSMFVMLPDEGLSMETVLQYMNEDNFHAALDTLSGQEVIFRMPKFKLETTTMLNRTLTAMGVKRVFTPSAELGGISDAAIAVDEVKQKCFVEVNEKGSEAAAVTSIGIRLTSANIGPLPVSMTVDRPFLFAIADTGNDNILFMGRVMNL